MPGKLSEDLTVIGGAVDRAAVDNARRVLGDVSNSVLVRVGVALVGGASLADAIRQASQVGNGK